MRQCICSVVKVTSDPRDKYIVRTQAHGEKTDTRLVDACVVKSGCLAFDSLISDDMGLVSQSSKHTENDSQKNPRSQLNYHIASDDLK